MSATVLSPSKELESAWMILRLELRNAAKQWAPRLMDRMNGFGAQPPDPAMLEPLARQLEGTLDQEGAAGVSSPTMRFLNKTFRPNEAERERRALQKAFNSYLEAWRKRKPS